jgi:hypothetical protein
VAAALAIDPAAIAEVALSIETPFPLRRRGMEARIVTGLERPSVDRVLCRTVARAPAWMDQVRAGASIAAIAIEGVRSGFIRARLPLALLSPQIAAAIGRRPASLSTELPDARTLAIRLGRASLLLGFESAHSHFPLSANPAPCSSLKFPCKLENIACSLVQGIAARSIGNPGLRRRLHGGP